MSISDREYSRQPYRPGFQSLSGTLWLIIVCVAVFLVNNILAYSSRGTPLAGFGPGPSGWGYFSVETAIFKFQFWRLFTYQFFHASLFHLAFNLIGIYFIGLLLESIWGKTRFLAFCLISGAGGALLVTLLSAVPGLLGMTPRTALVGSSGMFFGILAAAAIINPGVTIRVFMVAPLTVRTFALILLGLAVLTILAGGANAGGEAAHLGGAMVGWLLVRYPAILDQLVQHPSSPRHPNFPGKRRPKPSSSRPHSAEIDRILDKISQHGMQSLTAAERRTLEGASQRRD